MPAIFAWGGERDRFVAGEVSDGTDAVLISVAEDETLHEPLADLHGLEWCLPDLGLAE